MKKSEFAARRTRFMAVLAKMGLQAVVLDNRDDQFYFTGYTGAESILVFAVKAGKGWLITDSRYQEEGEKTASGVVTELWKSGMGLHVGKLLKKIRAKKVGYTPGSLTAGLWQAMRSEAPGVMVWQDVWSELMALRSVKSRDEIRAMRTALDCAEQAFLASKKRWKIGMTEIDVKNDLEWEMRRLGAEDASFETIVAVGANASLPHAHAGRTKIQDGKMLLVDFGARVDRYCSDLTRTVWAGTIPPAWCKRYEAVLEAQLAGIAAIRAGVNADVPYRAAVEVLAKAKFADRFTHSLGHGIGLAVHEFPRLATFNTKPLEAGNIVSCEPGVYFPGAGGIRTEDLVLVEKTGATVLSSLPKGIEDALL